MSSRECPAIEVDTSLPAARVIAVLDALALALPKSLVVDHGPEFMSQALDLWAYQHRAALEFIRPGKPVENAYIESFHSRFRDECLAAHWFLNLADARFEVEQFRRDYNNVRPHSSLGSGSFPSDLSVGTAPRQYRLQQSTGWYRTPASTVTRWADPVVAS